MEDLDPFAPHFKPTARRPLLGMTVLVVEDSRYASEALRLMCLHGGARIRRADCLRSARRHLQVYRPSVVVIDLGLPDGSGLELIEEMDRACPRVAAILAVSGNDQQHHLAITAGADAFLAKPIETVGVFQQAIVQSLPRDQVFSGPKAISMQQVSPDPMALRDDMTHIANLLEDDPAGPVLDYVAQFLSSLARLSHDKAMASEAADLAEARAKGRMNQAKVARLAGMVHERMQEHVAI